MPRHAIGDLFWDLELPENFLTRYLDSGTLLVEDPANVCFRIEISGITGVPKDPAARNTCVSSVQRDAAAANLRCTTLGDDKAYYHYTQRGMIADVGSTYEHWIVGFGNRKAEITLSYAVEDERVVGREALGKMIAVAVASIQLTHPELLTRTGPPVIRDRTESQKPWFLDQRLALSRRVCAALGIDEEIGYTLPDVDRYWAQFVANPPTTDEELNVILNGVSATFGEFLVDDVGFEWAVITDVYSTYLGIVALRGTANVTIDPFNFVAKRWERRESSFLVHAREEIRGTVQKFADE